MADVTITNVAKESKTPAIIGGGVLLGFMAQKLVNRMVGSETVQGLLGPETATNLKKYISPAIVTAAGVAINMSSKDDLMKNLAAGVAISGTVTIGMQALWGKNPLQGLNGFLGTLLDGDDSDLGDAEEDDLDGTEDDDDDDLGDLEDVEIEEEDGSMAALPPSNDINLTVDQSETNQMEGGIGDLLPSPAPGVRDPFPEPIFAGVDEDINLL